MTPERRKEIEALAKPDLKFHYTNAEPTETWRPVQAALRDALAEINRRGQLIRKLLGWTRHSTICSLSLHPGAAQCTCDLGPIEREADKVTRG